MAIFDQLSGETNDLSYSLDTVAARNNEPSIFESAGNVITKGVPLTAISAVNSFANTAIDIANFFGGDYKRLEVEDYVGQGDYLDYYKNHQQGIEVAGLIAGSLIPGGAAVKALKLAQLGKMGGALSRATNLFAGPSKTIIDDAIAQVANEGGLFNSFTADKFKAIALNFGDQTLQALTYELATAATMKASPIMDQDSFGDVVNNVFYGALIGGGIGGVIGGIGIRKTLNQALAQAEDATKAQQLATYLGKGGYFAGDKVAVLLASIDDIPEATTVLGRKKFNATYDNAILNSKKILQTMVKDGDEDLTNSMMDSLLRMKQEGQMTKDDMYNYLARLDKVSRVTDPELNTPTGTIFYVNRFAKDKEGVKWDDLVTTSPSPESEFSLGYRLRPYATETKVGRFDSTFEFDGKSVNRYNTAEEAFDDGNDLFIGKGNRIYINKNAPNLERVARPGESRPLTPKEEREYRETGQLPEGSQPLYGAPLVLNTISGAVKESAVPVVGDYGKVRLFNKGVLYGDKSSIQDLKSVITKDTETIDANARYVWAANRGLQRGDTILPDDVAMLEQVYREASRAGKTFSASIAQMEERGISISGMEMPTSADEMLNLIRQKKDDLITDLLQNNKLSSEEIALRANVPEDYLENALMAREPKDYMVDPAQWMRVNNVKMEYNIGSLSLQDGNIMKGMVDTQYRIQLIKDTLKGAAVEFFGRDYDQFIINSTSADATIAGAGPKLFAHSNANYGTLGQETERVGRFVTGFIRERMKVVSQKLANVVNAIRDDANAAAEVGMFRAVRQRTGEKFAFLPDEIQATEFGNLEPGERIAVLKSSLIKDKAGTITWNRNTVPENFYNGEMLLQKGETAPPAGNYTYYKLSRKVAEFEQANMEVNDTRLISRNDWYASQGLNRTMETGTLYTPPIDTTKYPHFALVKARPGTGLADDSVSIITAEDAAGLQQKIAALKDEYSVYTKDMLKKHHEVLGDYEYNRNFANSAVDTALRRKGILNNVFPDTRSETIIKDYIDWHTRQEMSIVRDHVEIANAQLFEELRQMGARFTAPETSRTGFVAAYFGRTVDNPYNNYIKTALGISERENYRLWAEANEKVEAFFSTAFRAAKDSFTAAGKGMISYEDASKVAEKFGLGNPYSAATDALRAYTEIANKLPPERYLSKFVSTANSVLAATTIRLDFFQSMINTISTPILLMAEGNSVRKSVIEKLASTELPDGTGRMIPATSKLMFNAVQNYFNKTQRDLWMPVYRNIQAVRTKSSEYFEMIDQLTLPYGRFTESEALARLKRGVELGAKLTGSELSEEFSRFVAADVGRQIFEASGDVGKQLTDNISTFVNRVHGNYIASQRPIAFQGPIGQAIGLFQTYQFNLLQQLFRYIENGDVKTIATLAGLQTTLFGMQGLPGFQMINSHIIGNSANNPAHKDIYSTTPNFFDKKLGDYLLYGVTSNWLNTGLYSRGDINPRQITILPTNPLDYPAISGGIRFVGNLIDTGEKIAKGGSIPTSLLVGLEHNGLSRPLSGLAQMVQGFSTTSKGDLIAKTRPAMGDGTAGWNDVFNITNFSRLAGARPLDEAIAMDALYRKTLYQAKETSRITQLGQAVKTGLYGGGQWDPRDVADFASSYAKIGGDITMFNRKMIDWTNRANASTANKLFKSLRDPTNQQMMQIMGGIPLPDFRNSGSTAASSDGDVSE